VVERGAAEAVERVALGVRFFTVATAVVDACMIAGCEPVGVAVLVLGNAAADATAAMTSDTDAVGAAVVSVVEGLPLTLETVVLAGDTFAATTCGTSAEGFGRVHR
jgi:hypothetical protein